jgi:hypothetical protein
VNVRRTGIAGIDTGSLWSWHVARAIVRALLGTRRVLVGVRVVGRLTVGRIGEVMGVRDQVGIDCIK